MYTKGLILLLPIRQSEKKNRMIKRRKTKELAKMRFICLKSEKIDGSH